MSGRRAGIWMALLGLLLLPVAHSSPPAFAQTEINYLLASVASSTCDFYRNGTWYDGKRAQAHLQYKYDSLVARDLINTAEDFIELAASRSSFSGRAYAIRCSGRASVPSSQWFTEALVRYRAFAGATEEPTPYHAAPRATCTAPCTTPR
jgi:hypothetical protein